MSLPPGAVYLVVGLLSVVENIFPPVPADTAVALGAFVASAGTGSAATVFLVTWVANVLGAAAVYGVAHRVGRPFFRSRLGQRLLRPAYIRRIELLYARYGTWGMFVSRFIPGVRGMVPPFAGVAGVSAGKALIPLAVASGIWYGILTWAVVTFAGELRDVARFIDHLNRWAIVVLGALALVAILAWRLRRRHATHE